MATFFQTKDGRLINFDLVELIQPSTLEDKAFIVIGGQVYYLDSKDYIDLKECIRRAALRGDK